MALELPIALVAIDNATHELTRLALEDTLAQVTPEQALVLTDAPEKIRVPGAEYRPFDGGYVAAMRALWYEVPALLRADYFIWVQWDSWALDDALWTDEFLEYDYIGAPWPIIPGSVWDRLGYAPGRNVGNGGFSLRSARLARFLADRREDLPQWLPEDDGICRKHRTALERAGFRFAPEELAACFSFECGERPAGGTFGFHGIFNFRKVLDPEAFGRRAAAAKGCGKWIN